MVLFVCFLACQFCFRVAATQCESTTIKRKVNLKMDNHSLFQQIPARLDQLEKDMQMIIKNQSNILAILQKLTHHDIPEDFPVNTVEELDKLDKQISKDVPKYYKIIAKIIRGDLAKNLDGILGPDLIMMLNYDGILGKMPFKQYFNVNNALLSMVYQPVKHLHYNPICLVYQSVKHLHYDPIRNSI
ncbi:hypothetical protein ACLKA7_007604 [Drosophila subpalustris]